MAKKMGFSDSSRIRHLIRSGIIKNYIKISGVWLVADTEIQRLLDLGYGKTDNNKNSRVQS